MHIYVAMVSLEVVVYVEKNVALVERLFWIFSFCDVSRRLTIARSSTTRQTIETKVPLHLLAS